MGSPLPSDKLITAACKARAHRDGSWLLGRDGADSHSDVEFIVVDAPVDIGLAQRARDRWGKPRTTMNLGERVGRVVSATDESYANGAAGVVGLDDYPDAFGSVG